MSLLKLNIGTYAENLRLTKSSVWVFKISAHKYMSKRLPILNISVDVMFQMRFKTKIM